MDAYEAYSEEMEPIMTEKIASEMRKRVALALYAHDRWRGHDWDNINPVLKDLYLRRAQAAINAMSYDYYYD